MTRSEQSKSGSRVGHWVRVLLMFLSFGFIFPHAMTEDEDVAKYAADKDAKVKKAVTVRRTSPEKESPEDLVIYRDGG